MKKLIYSLIMCAGVLFTSCEKDEVGNTATEALAGDWYVTVDIVDDAGNTLAEDPFGLGHTFLFTYNTAANIPTEMYVGRVLPQAATTPSGMPADSIVLYVSFSDDENPGTKYKVSGYRYTGFTADE